MTSPGGIFIDGNAAQQVRDQNTDGSDTIPAGPFVGSPEAIERIGLGTPLNESFEDWGIAPDLSLGRHLCADDDESSFHSTGVAK